MGELYPRHEKRTKNPAETTGNRYKIEILMSRTQKLKGLSAASLRLKTLNDNPYANKLDWEQWKHICKDYGMLSFGCAMSRLANKICGVKIPFECEWDDETDSRLLDDVLYRTTSGSVQRSNWQVRIDLVKSIFKNRWKYRMFSNTNFLMFCGRRV